MALTWPVALYTALHAPPQPTLHRMHMPIHTFYYDPTTHMPWRAPRTHLHPYITLTSDTQPAPLTWPVALYTVMHAPPQPTLHRMHMPIHISCHTPTTHIPLRAPRTHLHPCMRITLTSDTQPAPLTWPVALCTVLHTPPHPPPTTLHAHANTHILRHPHHSDTMPPPPTHTLRTGNSPPGGVGCCHLSV